MHKSSYGKTPTYEVNNGRAIDNKVKRSYEKHVLAEMNLLREVLKTGDYLIVEDTIIEHPVLPGWGAGPMEAIEEYLREYPDDYIHDIKRERKFGFTFAPKGFYIRR